MSSPFESLNAIDRRAFLRTAIGLDGAAFSHVEYLYELATVS
jgi:hypothetical protein